MVQPCEYGHQLDPALAITWNGTAKLCSASSISLHVRSATQGDQAGRAQGCRRAHRHLRHFSGTETLPAVSTGCHQGSDLIAHRGLPAAALQTAITRAIDSGVLTLAARAVIIDAYRQGHRTLRGRQLAEMELRNHRWARCEN